MPITGGAYELLNKLPVFQNGIWMVVAVDRTRGGKGAAVLWSGVECSLLAAAGATANGVVSSCILLTHVPLCTAMCCSTMWSVCRSWSLFAVSDTLRVGGVAKYCF